MQRLGRTRAKRLGPYEWRLRAEANKRRAYERLKARMAAAAAAREAARLREQMEAAAAVMTAACHIVFIAWRRPEYARQTLESLARHNSLEAYRLWYALDGAYAPAVRDLAEQAGFQGLYVGDGERAGIARTYDAAMQALRALAAPGDLVIHLEEDLECLRPIPMAACRALLAESDVGWVRLFGRRRGDSAAWEKRAVLGEDVLVGRSWWAHPPTLIRLNVACDFTAGIKDESQSIRRSLKRRLRCAWLTRAVFWHRGVVRSRDLGGTT